MTATERFRRPDDELLVAVIPRKRDMHILENEGWYRVPVDTAPRRWPPRYVAFYEGVALSKPGHVARYAEVDRIDTRSRKELFPGENPGGKAGRRYYQLRLKNLRERANPITLQRPRPLVFISTTFVKFQAAQTINDLWDDSPLEDRLWRALTETELPAERQWPVPDKNPRYFVDFAIFCQDGKLAVETDGHEWHSNPIRAAADNTRQNELNIRGWRLLRFSTELITRGIGESMNNVVQMVERLGGAVAANAWTADHYLQDNGGLARQLAFREVPAEYDAEEEEDW